jgi:hypothetical protein
MDYRPMAADLTARGGRQAALPEWAVDATRMRFQRLVFGRGGVEVSKHIDDSVPNQARHAVGMAT